MILREAVRDPRLKVYPTLTSLRFRIRIDILYMLQMEDCNDAVELARLEKY